MNRMKEPSRSCADLAQATDPLRISLADTQAPTPASLQKLLKEVLRSDADFDLFCSNHYKEQVYAQLGDGMSRTRKLEILFAHAEPAVPACEAVKIDPRRLQEVCGKATPDSDETCALARYLETESSADLPRVRSLLEGLRDHGPARFRSASKLKLARVYCKATEIEKASKEILDLAESASLCLQAKLAEPAACVAVSSGSRPVDPRIRELEGLHVESSESFGACPAPLRAAVLAGRARLRAGAGRWDEASADYGAAYSLDAKPFYGLYQAESLLHRKRPSEAHDLLQRLLGLLGKDRSLLSLRVRAALLDWIASRQQSDQGLRREADGALLSLHAMLSPGEPALEGPPDEELRSLACDDARGAPCIYDVLRRPSSKEALLQSLGGG